ncbi:MAG TPA: hydroxyacid dehydrogenase [Nitrososphaerales archaeon]|nr:hydroxyacid dehydrogenase [Nitrososphaerales archaeon]
MKKKMVRLLVCDRIDVVQLGLGENFEVDYRPDISREELLRSVGGYDGLVVRSRTRVDRDVMERASRLRLIARPGTGLDNIDVKAAESKEIAVVNSPESLVEAVAEHVILLMLALSRRLVLADSSVKAGEWAKEALAGSELKGRYLGIVGLGRIGRRVGEIAREFGMSITGYDVVPIPEEILRSLECKLAPLDRLLSAADYVTIHVPLTPETSHLIDSRRLSMMKKTAFLVNTSRGGVVEETSLVEALKEGKIAGAALDVFETEPPRGEILSAPNVVLTPHIAGQTLEAQADATKAVGRKIVQFFR